MADPAEGPATYADFEVLPPNMVGEILDGVPASFEAISFPLGLAWPLEIAPSLARGPSA